LCRKQTIRRGKKTEARPRDLPSDPVWGKNVCASEVRPQRNKVAGHRKWLNRFRFFRELKFPANNPHKRSRRKWLRWSSVFRPPRLDSRAHQHRGRLHVGGKIRRRRRYSGKAIIVRMNTLRILQMNESPLKASSWAAVTCLSTRLLPDS